MKIDFQFIKEWEPKYDDIVSDQEEYLALVINVSQDLNNIQSINIETFKRLINWKSPRAKGLIKWDKYNTYQKVFHLVYNDQQVDKMNELVVLPGIGAPIASTILHFIFPDDFPIYDFRTVEVLHCFGYFKYKTASLSHYQEFQKTLKYLRTNLVHYNLRQIDRALFAFHKKNSIECKRFSNDFNIKSHIFKERQAVDIIHSSDRGKKEKMTNLSIPEIIKSICEVLGNNGKVINRKDIIEKAKELEINESSVLPADYCDNTKTGQWSSYNFLHSISPGRYILAKYKFQSGK
ncbi:MAG: hypothetical protein M0P66_00235 [Salinivirgaceae bacterium]|nr:hypothetical protein [Salinivirgaceae bacterium]